MKRDGQTPEEYAERNATVDCPCGHTIGEHEYDDRGRIEWCEDGGNNGEDCVCDVEGEK